MNTQTKSSVLKPLLCGGIMLGAYGTMKLSFCSFELLYTFTSYKTPQTKLQEIWNVLWGYSCGLLAVSLPIGVVCITGQMCIKKHKRITQN